MYMLIEMGEGGGVEEGESWMAGGGGCAASVMDFAVEANVA